MPTNEGELWVAVATAMEECGALWDTYNLLGAEAACRLKDVRAGLDADLVGAGTRLWHLTAWCSEASYTAQHGRGFEVSDKSAGVSILVNNKKWHTTHETRVYDTLSSLQGLVGAACVQRRQDDITAIVMYWPPKPSRRGDTKVDDDTLHERSQLLEAKLQTTPTRSTPYIMAELNDRMGHPWDADKRAGRDGESRS